MEEENKKLNILIVVDMQNDFTYGSLANPTTVATIPKIEEKVKKYIDDPDGRVIFTRDTHFDKSYLDSEEGKHLPIKHCILNTKGWEIVDPLKKIVDQYDYMAYRYDDKVSVANKYSFGCSHLPYFINNYHCDEETYRDNTTIELVGTCTSLCVIANAFAAKMAAPNAHIVIDAECCSDVTEEMHNKALEIMQNAHMEIINWEKK